MSTIKLQLGAVLAALALTSACQLDTPVPEPRPLEPAVQVSVAELRKTDGDTRGGGGGGGKTTKSLCPIEGQIAVPEECNAFDDDCDGALDEGVCDDPCDQPW